MATLKRGNWTDEWREARKNTTLEEIEAIADRLEAEEPDRFSTPEQIRAMAGRLEEPQTAPRRVELVSA